jgi:hypothetical protein
MNPRPLPWLLTMAALLAPTSVRVTAQHDLHTLNGANRSSIVRAVRDATERFRDVNRAIAEGYVQFQGCVSGPMEGAMGVHYSKFGLFDGSIDLATPEALVYEPGRHGRLELVAAEYITPADAWNATHDDFDKPELMGQLFHFAPGPNRYGSPAFYELHVWAWKHNPRGEFADWNPTVSCADWEGASFER